jgi:hypothetical protein
MSSFGLDHPDTNRTSRGQTSRWWAESDLFGQFARSSRGDLELPRSKVNVEKSSDQQHKLRSGILAGIREV